MSKKAKEFIENHVSIKENNGVISIHRTTLIQVLDDYEKYLQKERIYPLCDLCGDVLDDMDKWTVHGEKYICKKHLPPDPRETIKHTGKGGQADIKWFSEVKTVPYQRCPRCDGHGVLWSQYPTSTNPSVSCNTCNGKGIIPQHVIE